MKSPESESFFEQGETSQGRWQARAHRQRTRQGWRESYAYAQTNSSGNSSHSQILTETTVQDHTFQVSPDGTVILIQSTAVHSHSSSRSGC